jgi:hypothetical protein
MAASLIITRLTNATGSSYRATRRQLVAVLVSALCTRSCASAWLPTSRYASRDSAGV